jgi:exodeoxyribonuclease V beta subunit
MTFDVNAIRLQGRHLVEASAGTGKTYSIANLFLRLLLEPHASNDNLHPLSVEQILVVTFTNAATDELCGRIRKKIEEALTAFSGGESKDEFITQYKNTLQETNALEQACQYLYDALLCIDEAAIFTIHSFASRAIQAFLFETGALADVEMVIGSHPVAEKVKADLKRRAIMRQEAFWQLLGDEKDCAQIIRLLKVSETLILPAVDLQYDDKGIPLLEESSEMLVHRLKELFNVAKKQWQALLEEHSDKVVKESLKAVIDNTAGSSRAGEFIKHIELNLSVEPNTIKALANVNGVRLSRVGVEHILTDNIWYDFVILYKAYYDYSLGLSEHLKALLHHYYIAVIANIEKTELTPEDVIRLLNNTLKNPLTKLALQKVITQTYPVCLVDEFQDTDPEQFYLFDRLYENTEMHSLFAIGDPKQSIYGFRGADIFAYLSVKQQVDKNSIHTLDTNYRSKQHLMQAINALFKEQEDAVFYYSGIEYEPVDSCEDNNKITPIDKGQLKISGNTNQEAMVFVGYEDSEDIEAFNDVIHHYAEDAAERIVGLLHSATLVNDGEEVALEAKDIAVLVRDMKEANAMKNALYKRNLQAVYLSQKDSVFSQCVFAEDLFLILLAIDEPNNKARLKAAFATPLLRHFSYEFSMLNAIDNDDDAIEQCIADFSHYQRLWDKKGILAVLNDLLMRRHLEDTFATHVDRDRLMTDFRHLGELLQQQYLKTGSRERLIEWYQQQLSDDSALEEESKSLRLESDANLVKIVTLHGCKGLEYPVVFMPFFFGFKGVDTKKNLPAYHFSVDDNAPKKWQSVIDYGSSKTQVEASMNEELRAENMRLFYVGVTRAIYQCYIGVCAAKYKTKSVFLDSVWAKLLGIQEDAPTWQTIKDALMQRMANTDSSYTTTLSTVTEYLPKKTDVDVLIDALPKTHMPDSAWLITSYSALAHNKKVVNVATVKDDEVFQKIDATAIEVIDKNDASWKDNIRFSLRGSANTGECLHRVYEILLQEGLPLEKALESQLRIFGLAKPEGIIDEKTLPEKIAQRRADIAQWLNQTLNVPLSKQVPSLQELFATKQCLPEMAFDFSLGTQKKEVPLAMINRVLQQAGVADIARADYRNSINGIMTGSIDLLFMHNKKVYVLDYKSNTLGKSPRFYDNANMNLCMKSHRYDLQYAIYSVAAHRFMRQRLGERYDYDEGEYSFGGVFYLFIRGMGLAELPQHGIWFERPETHFVEALDAAFSADEVEA